MANLTNQDFITCKPTQYKGGCTNTIDEIISLEEEFSFNYQCVDTDNGQEYSGTKELFAYPHKLDELIIGHTILDILPCYNADFEYNLAQDNNDYNLKLSAKTKQYAKMPKAPVKLPELVEIMQNVLAAQGKWDGTGCFHRAALYHPVQKTIIIAEDIGRHNCVDRLKGHAIINKLDLHEYYLFITARITSSIYFKIRRAGINTIISRAAITSTAYLNAKQDNCTLAAFCRPNEKRVTLFSS